MFSVLGKFDLIFARFDILFLLLLLIDFYRMSIICMLWQLYYVFCGLIYLWCSPRLVIPPPQGSGVMAKYVALYAADLIKSNDPISALKLYIVHGAPAVPQNFNTYRRLCVEVFNLTDEAMTSYLIYANLRDLLFNLVSCLAS